MVSSRILTVHRKKMLPFLQRKEGGEEEWKKEERKNITWGFINLRNTEKWYWQGSPKLCSTNLGMDQIYICFTTVLPISAAYCFLKTKFKLPFACRRGSSLLPCFSSSLSANIQRVFISLPKKWAPHSEKCRSQFSEKCAYTKLSANSLFPISFFVASQWIWPGITAWNS